jgi:hypothetical protein
MAMSRKDFVAMAAAMKAARRDILTKEAPERHADMLDGVSLAAEHLADVLNGTNANFDRARFLDACGVEG